MRPETFGVFAAKGVNMEQLTRRREGRVGVRDLSVTHHGNDQNRLKEIKVSLFHAATILALVAFDGFRPSRAQPVVRDANP
jgi:hypothetical protein